MAKDKSLLKLLKKVNYFTGLSDDILSLLAEKMCITDFKPEDYICHEGDKGDWMFVVVSGEISVQKKGNDDIPVEITTLAAGDIGGEMSLFGGSQVRSASLKAVSKVKLCTLDHGTFHDLLDKHSELSRALLSNLSGHLSAQGSVMAKLMSRDLDRRLKVAFFDSKSYMEEAFKARNRHDYRLQFFESRLTMETVSLAAGFKAVCIFVNDDVNTEVVRQLKALGIELIALRCAGYNNVDLAECEKLGISVVRVPAYSPYAVAEHAIALMMTLNRRVHRAHNRVRESNFSLDGLVGFDLHGKTAGLIGAGKIGRCVLSILKGFGCKLLVNVRNPDQELADAYGVEFVSREEIYKQSDIISLHAPLTRETHHMISTDAINMMKKGVMLINTSRGGLVDSAALLEGLKDGQVGYAGLDVYEEESSFFFEDFSDKVMADDLLARLTTFNNVVVTSHQAFLTKEALMNIADTTMDNVKEWENGKSGTEMTNHVAAS